MTPFALYIIKVVGCSGVLFGYYYFMLRNKTFYQWNRFYLLACVVLSLTAPLLKIEINSHITPAPDKVFKMLHVVNAGSELEVESKVRKTAALTPEQYTTLGYSLISVVLLFLIVANSFRIYKILRSYPRRKIGNVLFLNTDAKGTPFSFFHYIIWNYKIDLSSEAGQRIFQHELTHVQQRHSWDKVFLLLILVPFWINPFFWLMRKELAALHEFAADQNAMKSQDVNVLAQMILNTTFPEQQFLFTNHLFQSTIKRRIAMFTKLQNPKVSYVGRIIALPVLLVVIAAFSIKTKAGSVRESIPPEQAITVVIDAGHGALDDGAHEGDVYESEIALAIAQKIKAQNRDKNIRIVLTRKTAETVDLKRRVEIASDAKANLFLSIHVNAAPEARQLNGMEVVVSSKQPPYQHKSEILGSALVQELGRMYTIKPNLVQKETGIWVVDHNVCPAVLIECGYLTNEKDLAFIRQEQNQTRIATKILDAIARYAVLKNNGESYSAMDSTSKLMYKGKEVIGAFPINNGKDVVVSFKDGMQQTVNAENGIEFTSVDNTVDHWEPPVNVKYRASLLIHTAKIEDAEQFKGTIELNDQPFKSKWQELPFNKEAIQIMSFLCGPAIEKEFGIGNGDSVLSIYTKPYAKSKTNSTKPIFTAAETEPKFPETNGGWKAFLQRNLKADVGIKNGAKSGTYKVIVQFVVDENGKLLDIKPLTHNGYGMEDEVVRLMKTSPDWIPAMQNGQKVTAYKKQTVTFVIAEG